LFRNIKSSLSEKVRFDMEISDETTVTRGSIGELYGLPQSCADWAILVGDNRAIASKFSAGDLSLAEQAAAETDTQYYVAQSVEEAGTLAAENRRRIAMYGSPHSRLIGLRYLDIQSIQKEEERRAKKLLEAGGAVVALACKEGKGLDDFWRAYDGLRQDNPELSES